MAQTAATSTYVVECTCGHNVEVGAPDRESAIREMKKMMDESGVKEHFQKLHRGEPMPSVAEVHAHIENDIKET